ncbi:MAG TPA: VWA domain-containing protein [Coriobacteriia bacterium]
MRRILAIALLAGTLVASVLPATAVAQNTGLSVYDVATTGYPTVEFKVGLPPLLTAGGGEPQFSVKENGQPASGVRAKALTGPANAAHVILLIDTSGSMTGKPMDDAKASARAFIQSLGPDAQVAVVSFANAPRTVTGFTSSRAALDAAIASLNAKGSTAVYDAIVSAAGLMPATAAGQRAIVLLSDGGDTVSSADFETARSAVVDAGAPVYAVDLRSKEDNPQALQAIADGSGGRLMSVAQSSELSGLFASIASEIRNAWLVSYTSGKPHTKDIELEVSASAAGEVKVATIAFPNPVYATADPASVSGVTVAKVTADPVLFATIAGLIFVSIALLVGAVLLLLVRGKANLGQLEYYDQLHAEAVTGPETGGPADQVASRIVDAVGHAAGKRGITALVAHRLELAGLPLRAAEYMTIHIVVVALSGAVVELLTGSLLWSLVVVLLATLGPIIGLGLAITSRRTRFEAQLPDVLNMVAGSLRGGWGIQQALGLVVQQAAPPAAPEFKRVEAETRLGMPLEQSLQRMADRFESADFQSAVTAISIQREVGGNLAAVLDIVATTIRDRAALVRHVSSLTAESRLSAYILIGLPFLILGVLFLIRPTYLQPLLATPVGWGIAGAGVSLLVIGIIWISKVSKVEV